LDEKIGKLSMGISKIPENSHFTLPYFKKRSEEKLSSQMISLSKKF
jgi:hypothetical protein